MSDTRGSDQTVVLIRGVRTPSVADHTKWGVVGLSSFARLDQADILITDAGLDPPARDQLAATARRLIVVDVASPLESGTVTTIPPSGRS